METVERLSIPIQGADAGLLGTLEIADQGGRRTIEKVDDPDPDVPQVQLVEEQSYEFAFLPATGAPFAISPQFVSPFIPSRLSNGAMIGTLPSSRFVGTTVLHFCNVEGARQISLWIEVRSRKLEYLTEFYAMLDELSGITVDLVTTLKSSFTTDLKTDPQISAATVQQRLLFLKSICESQEIFSAFNRVETLPHSRLVGISRTRSISQAGASSRELAASLVMSRERIPVPPQHPLAVRFKALPAHISGMDKRESMDTAENRFVKFVIRNLIEFIERANIVLRKIHGVDRTLLQWLMQADKSLKEVASREFFKEIGRLAMLPMGSPALQRKHGYRQILDAWIKFNSASRVNWEALDEVFAAGQRDAALLYEYWCFFILRDGIKAALALEDEQLGHVLRYTEDGLTIVLKTGAEAAVKGRFVFRGRQFGIRYAYQRAVGGLTTSRVGLYSHADANRGSWSKAMEPDYTISIWPYVPDANDGGECEAEVAGRLCHVHFDAKYRLSLVGESGDGGASRLRAKGDDVDKMHSYLSAIRGSWGAYVLYPGEVTEFYCEGADSAPGVGFIAVRPGESGIGKEEIRAHIIHLMGTLYERVYTEH